jgi:hypothetical protein
MTQMYYDEHGIWSLSEIVMNEKKDKEMQNDLYHVLKGLDRYGREHFSDLYFEGMKRGFQNYHPTPTDYMNCCLEEAIDFSKDVKETFEGKYRKLNLYN